MRYRHLHSAHPQALNKALVALRAKAGATNPFHEIHLNGLVHTSDRAALADMIRGLSLENQVDINSFVGTAYVQLRCMRLLLTLHVYQTSFAECFMRVFDSLKEAGKDAVPIVVVLDEFDQFVTHNNQSLLYNLFDTVQSCRNSLTVIGVSCRHVCGDGGAVLV